MNERSCKEVVEKSDLVCPMKIHIPMTPRTARIYQTTNIVCTMTPTSTSMLIHFTGLMLCAALTDLDCISGQVHVLWVVLSPNWWAQLNQISTLPVLKLLAFVVTAHSHIVEGIPVGIDVPFGVMVMVALLVVTEASTCLQQMEATVALLLSQYAA